MLPPINTDTHRASLERKIKFSHWPDILKKRSHDYWIIGKMLLDALERLMCGCERKTVLWIMLNPSTATKIKDDPTIIRCKEFSAYWACYEDMLVVNLFSYKTSNQDELIKALKNGDITTSEDEDERKEIIEKLKPSDLIVAAWGGGPDDDDVKDAMQEQIRKVKACTDKAGYKIYCLGRRDEGKGQPRHPSPRFSKYAPPIDTELELYHPLNSNSQDEYPVPPPPLFTPQKA